MTKSQSMPCHVTALPPDPFPELSQHKMRLYRFHDEDRAGERSLTSEVGRTSPCPMSGTASNDVSASETSDAVTQVVVCLQSHLPFVMVCSRALQNTLQNTNDH